MTESKKKSKQKMNEEATRNLNPSLEGKKRLIALDFEVFGKVQRVYFRKYTMMECKRLGITGWVMNTPRDSVIGVLEGEEENVQRMMYWLQYKGSPKCQIEKATFRNKREIKELSFTDFTIRK